MQVATWNVNSVRSRLQHVSQWLDANPVEVLCLQETKVVDETFPQAAFQDLGYHCQVHGQKSYNGVALITRQPLQTVGRGFGAVLGAEQVGDLDDQARVIYGVVDGVCVVNLYVPNGSSIGSDKYAYKLRWLACLKVYLATLLDQYPYLNLCGDINIAPADIDIYNPEGKATHIMSSPQERASLAAVLDLGLTDAFRLFTQEGGYFSWWDYRAASFRRNLGWRIDHHYLSADLVPQTQRCYIDPEPRGWEKPSDHTPVVVEYVIANP